MKLFRRKKKKTLKDYITKENIETAKVVVSELLEKKSELQCQIADFKEDIQRIKARKEELLGKINELSKDDEEYNRVYALVAKKRKGSLK